MADRFQSLPASLLEETYKLHPWYILIKDDVSRVDSRFPKSAEKGELFYYDASSQSYTKGYREKGSKSKKVIMTAVCSRVQVCWSPDIFAPLNHKEKELLEAIPSTKQRYMTFSDQKDYLSFGARLQIDNCVQVCAGALRVPTANDVHGTLKYIGPLRGQNGTMFGIHLSTNHGNCSGTHISKRYFTCEPSHGIFLPINKLVPVSRPDKPTQQETTKKVKHCRAADLGTEDVPQPTMLKVGVTVEAEAFLTDSPQKKTWVKGTIVNIVVFEGNTLFAVELERFEKPAVNSNGFYKGKSVYEPKKPNSTVIVKQSAIRQIHSSPTSGKEEDDAERNDDGKEHFGDDEQRTMSCNSQREINQFGKEEVDAERNDDGKEHFGDDEQRTMSYNSQRETNQSDDHQSFNSSDIKFPPKTQKSEETAGETPSKAKGKAARKSEDQEDENKKMLQASSNVVKNQPSSMDIDEHHFATNSRQKGGTSWSSDNHENDRKPSDGSKGIISTFKSMWKSPDPPPFPFKLWHIGVIASDTKVFETLVKQLKIKQRPDRSQREANMVDIADFIFRKWWKEDIHEGYKEAEAKFLEVLDSCGYEELVYFIKGGKPHHGRLHDSVIETVLHRAKKYLRLLAKHMEQDIPVDSSHLDLAGEQLFDTWQERHRGIEKLTLLIRAIRGVHDDLKSCNRPKQDIDDISDLAYELEQGLSGEVIMDISKSVTNREWSHLGFALGLTDCRLQSFYNSQRVLKDRVHIMLRYWQMCQSYDVDQAEKLIVALQACNCSHKIASISKGLDETHLRSVADCIDGKWKQVAAVVCNPADIEDISKRSEPNRDKALLVLRKWKRKQPSKVTSLLECLAKTLKECHLHKAARILYDGLDAGTVICLANKLAFDWQPLGRQLFGEKFQKEKFEAVDDAVQCTFQMLETWNKKNIGNPDRIAMLYKALKTIGRQDIEEWLKNYIDSDQTMEYHLRSSPPSSHRQEPEYKRVDQNLLREVAVKLKEGKADLTLLKDALQIKTEDEKSNPMTPSLRIDDPYLFALLTWRAKMRNHKVGRTQIGQNLREALEMCASPDVASFLTDGTPVDRKKDAQQDGAVGGIDPNMETDFNVSSMVEVEWGGKLYHGTITWIGIVTSVEEHGKIAAIEVDEDLFPFGTNHYFANQVLHAEESFESANTLFVPLTRCRPDGRFPTESQTLTEHVKVTSEDFGGIEWKPVEGYVPPPGKISENLIGLFKGIQGDHNSCYMDGTLYSMFAFSDLFDGILRSSEQSDKLVQDIRNNLRENIVNPLRMNGVVSAKPILAFRDLLNDYSNMKGLRTEEKDPEEFIHTLLQELLNAEPFLRISQGNGASLDSFVYQIFLDKKDYLSLPTVEQLVHLSFLESDLKLTEVPEVFIVQLPRFGKSFKLYDWIMPSFTMDITTLVKNATRACLSCGKLAFMECKDCRPDGKVYPDVISSFCRDCWEIRHGEKRHRPNQLSYSGKFVKNYYQVTAMDQSPEKGEELHEEHTMELFSIMCIETSHYVAFVKAGQGENDWVFFDSMADRQGDHKGFNVPEVSHMSRMMATLKDPNILENLKKPKFPRHWKRLMGDAYICFYKLVKKPERRDQERGQGEFSQNHGYQRGPTTPSTLSESNTMGYSSQTSMGLPDYVDNMPTPMETDTPQEPLYDNVSSVPPEQTPIYSNKPTPIPAEAFSPNRDARQTKRSKQDPHGLDSYEKADTPNNLNFQRHPTNSQTRPEGEGLQQQGSYHRNHQQYSDSGAGMQSTHHPELSQTHEHQWQTTSSERIPPKNMYRRPESGV